MPLFQIIHASDLHFGKNPEELGIAELFRAPISPSQRFFQFIGTLPHRATSHSSAHALAFAEWIHANASGIDLLLISGDLATTGDQVDLEAAKAYLFNPSDPNEGPFLDSRKMPTLRTVKEIRVMPGNHDRYDGVGCWPGGSLFNAHFPPESTNKNWQKQPVRVLFNEVRHGVRIILIGADLTLRQGDLGTTFTWMGGPWSGFWGQGRADQTRVNELVAVTNKQRTKKSVLLWVIHFDPLCAAASLELLERNNLLAALEHADVDAILCGHTHNAELAKPITCNKGAKQVPVFVSGTATQFASATGNEFLVVDIDWSNNQAAIKGTRYSFRNKSFKPQKLASP